MRCAFRVWLQVKCFTFWFAHRVRVTHPPPQPWLQKGFPGTADPAKSIWCLHSLLRPPPALSPEAALPSAQRQCSALHPHPKHSQQPTGTTATAWHPKHSKDNSPLWAQEQAGTPNIPTTAVSWEPNAEPRNIITIVSSTTGKDNDSTKTPEFVLLPTLSEPLHCSLDTPIPTLFSFPILKERGMGPHSLGASS